MSSSLLVKQAYKAKISAWEFYPEQRKGNIQMSKSATKIPIRGFLLHITHYDPEWRKKKLRGKAFDINLALELIDEMHKACLNLLVIDCADGVRYKSHPELARTYTVPMSHLEKLVKRAKEKGIEVVPKLNFAQSRYHCHNHWMYPYNEVVNGKDLFDSDEYWKIGSEIIDELINVCRPKHYFHIGMDEDDARAHSLFIKAIIKLHTGLKERGLRTIMWKDTRKDNRGLIYTEKHLAAEKKIPNDVIQIVWKYTDTADPKIIRRLVQKGFEVWGAPGWENSEQVLKWKQMLLRYGGKGLLMTRWIPCCSSNRSKLLKLIRTIGPIYEDSEI